MNDNINLEMSSDFKAFPTRKGTEDGYTITHSDYR